MLLNIDSLNVSIQNKKILNQLNIKINPGEVHAIMGPNGAGKSTLSNVICGNENYIINSGDIFYKNESIIEDSVDERSRKGIFMSFQYPIEIPGISVFNFLQLSITEIRKYKGLPDMKSAELLNLIREKAYLLGINNNFLTRYLNYGFSGGEKKKNEILQLLLLNPSLAVLDETDSGLDIDALKVVSKGINYFRNSNNGVLLITHYQRLLDYVEPDYVHVMIDGTIVKSGDKYLAIELEKKGYDWIK